ncbi:acyloxyacyl hydrolase-like [Watersipora subatra]|uniref:acyloxyacyl hydrolase-like n=1 Tax=Watersipora subatra TaxID=2589382 RepID=UPI00355C111B
MAKYFFVVIFVTLLAVKPSTSIINHKFFRGIDGGLECATCTVLLGLLDQLAEVNNQTIVEAADALCLKLPTEFQKPCQTVSDILVPIVVEMLAESANPDDICRGLALCYTKKGTPPCALYKKTLKFDAKRIAYYQKRTRKHLLHRWNVKLKDEGSWSICELPVINLLCVAYSDVFDKQVPFYDDDKDLHSTEQTLRGVSWKGKDCDDTDKDVYPGRKPKLLHDVSYDSNCNGIWGFDNQTGKSYEEQFCDGTGQIGVVVIGDSVGAHFHAPQEWFDPQLLTKASLHDLPFALENELDWPQLSLVTGYMNSTWSVAPGQTDSLYYRLFKRNRCNHRNYQNLAINGRESKDIVNVTRELRIDKNTDYPLLLIVELVGNDVCNNKPSDETLKYMTTDKEMHDNLVQLFEELNKIVPSGSKVLIVGMADGDFLFKFLENRYHPFGRLRQDLKYPDIYDWWNCMRVTPCMGWLNSNATLRNLTTQRANALSQVMSDLSRTHQHHWSNLELNYVKCPITTVITKYLVEHGPDSGYQLIEPVDGFHPNQVGQALSAAEVWRHMELNLSHYLGDINKNNDAIKKVFKDQGGYN